MDRELRFQRISLENQDGDSKITQISVGSGAHVTRKPSQNIGLGNYMYPEVNLLMALDDEVGMCLF